MIEVLRMKTYRFLIWLANRIKVGSFYDFGEQVVSLVVFHERLYVGTKNSLYRKNKTNDKWKKVS